MSTQFVLFYQKPNGYWKYWHQIKREEPKKMTGGWYNLHVAYDGIIKDELSF